MCGGRGGGVVLEQRIKIFGGIEGDPYFGKVQIMRKYWVAVSYRSIYIYDIERKRRSH